MRFTVAWSLTGLMDAVFAAMKFKQQQHELVDANWPTFSRAACCN
jgi:hypothetical protein